MTAALVERVEAVVSDDAPGHLVRVDPHLPGWTRRKAGKGWSFRDETGAPIKDPAVVGRIKQLAIPPAWKDVWISPVEEGHIQAVGTDDAGRRQYRYHEEWRQARALVKYDRVLRLGARMPVVRAVVAEQIAGKGLSAERVLAAAVRLLDIGVFRVGSEEYAPSDADDEEGTYGLATIRREHVTLKRGGIVFDYLAKGGIERVITLRDEELHKVVKALLNRKGGGEELLAHRGPDGEWVDVRSADINAHLKALAGHEFTAKDLRTWGATVLAAVALAEAAREGVPTSQRGRATVVNAAIDRVAEHLGNTRTVARASYVDPRVIGHWEEGRTILPVLESLGDDVSGGETQLRIEAAVLDLLRPPAVDGRAQADVASGAVPVPHALADATPGDADVETVPAAS